VPAPPLPPAPPPAPVFGETQPRTSAQLALLQALERGEIDVDEAMRRLDNGS
jgi:hypothetical protein